MQRQIEPAYLADLTPADIAIRILALRAAILQDLGDETEQALYAALLCEYEDEYDTRREAGRA